MPARRASAACEMPLARRFELILRPIGARNFLSRCHRIDRSASEQVQGFTKIASDINEILRPFSAM
jgi:hypothetical protein